MIFIIDEEIFMKRITDQKNGDCQPQAVKYIAIYLRLSDEDKKDGILKTESESIINQRSLIHYFIQGHSELSGCPVREFVDDGSSGVNFRRSGIQQLLEEVKKKRVACIIVKDLSRFGRNYIEAGRYLEQFFPQFGVRFIAVVDQYDSFSFPSEIEVGFKNLFSDRYSRDLSKKIKSVKSIQQKQGIYSGGDVPYGYTKGTNRQQIFQPDPEAAAHVREIFFLAAAGNSPSAIAKYLNQHKVPTPGAYKTEHTDQQYQLKNKKRNLWTSLQIRIILQNETYLGTYLCHKSTTNRPREYRQLDVTKYLRFAHAHPALISEEVFESAQKVLKHYKKRGGYKKKSPAYPLAGKIKCGYCGYSARLGGKAPFFYFSCRMGESCGSRFRVKAQELDGLIKVLEYYRNLLLNENCTEAWLHRIELYEGDRIELLVLMAN